MTAFSARPPRLPGASLGACDCCGAVDDFELLFSAVADETRAEFDIRRCRSCGLVALRPQPADGMLRPYYTGAYYGPDNTKFEPITETAVAGFTRWRAFVLRRWIPRRGRALDIGCGRGNFLEVLASKGLDVHGTELTELAARRAVDLFGDRIHIGEIAEAGYADRSFDLITMWHVLEHVRRPATYLSEAHRLLADDGHLIIAVPNFASLQARLGGPEWFHLDVPRHLHHFTPKTLGRMLLDRGLVPVTWNFQSIEQNPFGLLQTALNRLPLGLPRNALYRLLKKQSTVELSPLSAVLLRLAYYLLMPPAIVLAALGGLVRRGGTFYVVARRRASSSPPA